MYVDSELLKKPCDENAKIWRFMDLPKFLDLLESGDLYFTQLARLREIDPYEGWPSHHFLHWPHGLKGVLNDDAIDAMEHNKSRTRDSLTFFSKSLYVSCWHLNDAESAAMWKLYADKGVAIQSTFKQLCEAFGDSRKHLVYVGQTTYHDYRVEQITAAGEFGGAFNKRISFECEREIRALVKGYSPEVAWQLVNSGKQLRHRKCFRVPVDLRTLIQKIYISPDQQKWFKNLIPKVLERYGLSDLPIEDSELSDRPELI